MNSMIQQLKQIAIEKGLDYPDDDFVLRGLWNIHYRYRPNKFERDLAYSMILAQTKYQGCCYVDYQTPKIQDSFLGQDARTIESDDIGTTIAILDAIYSVFHNAPNEVHYFEGTSEEKAVKRAKVVVNEVLNLLKSIKRPKVLNTGVMGIFIKTLQENGVSVIGSDFDVKLINEGINETIVVDGDQGIELIKNSDAVLVTGMTLWTQTLQNIIKTAKLSDTKVIVFAATGANFGQVYCDSFGVDVVISEPQPQYMFQGQSQIKIYRKNKI